LLAFELGLQQDITFTGFISEADKAQLLAGSDVFVIASPAELQSIATLEAMSSGLPVLAVDKVALRELCHNGKNGYSFEENDFQMLAKKMLLLLNNPEKRKRFGKKSREIVEKNHDLGTSLEHYLDVYKKIQKTKK
jgi:glycosyltransferase involved in cell wall biosynthesis